MPGEVDFHAKCAKKFWGTSKAPELNFSLEELDNLASQVILEQTSLTGVQPKLSLHLQEHEGSQRLTIVGLWGDFIMKPQTQAFAQLPEVEDLTMHLAEKAKIAVVPHSLMKMKDGSICYITRRIDRDAKGGKIVMEDFCQLGERLTEYKYRSSYEKIGKDIRRFSSVPQLDVVTFFEIVFFSWLTGNNDMHLKNFSLYAPDGSNFVLTPAYDLLNAAIVNPADSEELALTLNGRKRKLNKGDFEVAADTMGMQPKIVSLLMKKYSKLFPAFCDIIDTSFLSKELKENFKTLLSERLSRLRL